MSTIPAVDSRMVFCEQGSKEWFDCRLGSMTSSRVADGTAKRKRVKAGEVAEEMACRRDMRFELVLERLTGKATEHYVSRWMKEGKEKEPLARTEYEIATDCTTEQVGYIYHPTLKWAGASPDGLVGDDGLVEIKCPSVYTHLEYLLSGEIPEDYQKQMLWQMACSERQWCDFVSYSPDVPQEYQLFIVRLERDDKSISGMTLEVEQFLADVDKTLAELKERIRHEAI